jgi:hypothetical protein
MNPERESAVKVRNERPVGYALALGAVALVLAGCTASTLGPPPPAPTMTEAERIESYESGLDSSWETVTFSNPDAVRPDVEFVRFIDQDEWAQVIVDCLTAEGMDAKVSTDGQGGFESSAPSGQASAMDMARYVCDAKYPIDPALHLPPTEAELAYLYDYFALVLTPCLKAEGYEVIEPPSRQVFLDTYGTKDMWSPYRWVSNDGGQDEWERINRACPQGPPGFRGGGG